MLNTPKTRTIYEAIRKQLFRMIPEKWDRIYLYASIIQRANQLETGEMFFYYFPKGLLKRSPVNVYEIPNRFNIEENSYMILVDKLYSTIKELKREFEEAGERKWTNITIKIENFKFIVEFNYENLLHSKYSSYERHLIWRYNYLSTPLEFLSRKDKKLILNYISEKQFQNEDIQIYTEPMYKKSVHNTIKYNQNVKTDLNKFSKTLEQQNEENKRKKSQILNF